MQCDAAVITIPAHCTFPCARAEFVLSDGSRLVEDGSILSRDRDG